MRAGSSTTARTRSNYVWIVELRDKLVQRETIYFAEPFPAPDWREPWAEKGGSWEVVGDLPAHILVGGGD